MELNRKEIFGSRPGPRVLITGGIHGDEFEPMAAIRRLAREIRAEELRGSVTLVPVVNEPAFRLGQRTAEDGRDLARTCPGRHDGSVTERIAAALSELIRAADYYIDLHSGGTRLVVQPLVGYMLHRDPAVLAAQRRMARAFDLPIIWGTDPNLDGRSLSVARDAGVPAIYAEYLGGGLCAPAGVAAYVRGCQNVLLELDMLDSPLKKGTGSERHAQISDESQRPEVPVPFFQRAVEGAAVVGPQCAVCVEDDRAGAGHMQVNHSTPGEGFFEPAVKLGQQINAGDLLGTVRDVWGERISEIRAKYDGLVIVLCTFARVNAGDGVAVLLPGDLLSAR